MRRIDGGCSQQDKVVKIGHKNYTEQRLAGQMLAVLIEAKTDYEAEVTEFGGTIFAEALKTMKSTYTRYGHDGRYWNRQILIRKRSSYVKGLRNSMDNVAGRDRLNNTYILSVTAETAKELGVSTVSELSHANDMIIGCDNEFLAYGRAAGLKEVYGINFTGTADGPELTYAAARRPARCQCFVQHGR